MKDEPYTLDARRQRIVLEAMLNGARHRGWKVVAAYVRTTHVHVVITAKEAPERVMTALKAYASAGLNAAATDMPNRRRWTRHGSACVLATPEAIRRAASYVVGGQGKEMAVYLAPGAMDDTRADPAAPCQNESEPRTK